MSLLFLLPQEIWEEIFTYLRIKDLHRIELISFLCHMMIKKYFDTIYSVRKREYNLLYYDNRSIISLTNYHDEYQTAITSCGSIFSINNEVLIYECHKDQIIHEGFCPFITTIRSYKDFSLLYKHRQPGHHVQIRELPNGDLKDIIMDRAKHWTIINLSSHIINMVSKKSLRCTFYWGIRKRKQQGMFGINMITYPDILHSVIKELSYDYPNYRIDINGCELNVRME